MHEARVQLRARRQRCFAQLKLCGQVGLILSVASRLRPSVHAGEQKVQDFLRISFPVQLERPLQVAKLEDFAPDLIRLVHY